MTMNDLPSGLGLFKVITVASDNGKLECHSLTSCYIVSST